MAAEDAQRSRGARPQSARRHRHDRWHGRIWPSRPPSGHSSRATSRCARARLRSPRAIFAAMAPFHNYPVGRAERQSLGRGARAAVYERPLAVLLLAARERPVRPRRRQPQGHRAYLHLRTHRVRQDGVHRLSRHAATAARRDAGDLRQGPRTRDSGALPRRRISGAAARRSRPGSIHCSCRSRRTTSSSRRAGCACWCVPGGGRELSAREECRSRAGAARHARARAGRPAAVAAARVPRSHGSRRRARTAGALVRVRAGRLRLGIRQPRRLGRAEARGAHA